MIDEKDLRKMKASEATVGGYFYRKNDQGKMETCRIDAIKGFDVEDLKKRLLKDEAENRLFVRISKPWHNFA
jgi:hypothetical protein